jgi:formyltetrahydrofolate deformylase
VTTELEDHSREQNETPRYTARLLIGCADQPGIVAAVSGFLFGRGANIVDSHQYSSDPSGGRFFLRTGFFLPESPAVGRERLQPEFDRDVGARFEMDWNIRWWGQRQRIGILVSRHDHCLLDLLWRWRRGELDAEIVAVISNHRDLEEGTVSAGVAFHHVPVDEGGREHAEAAMLTLLQGNAELLVLARYMQVLSASSWRAWVCR